MNGEEWREQRKFSLRTMRDLGMGKQAFEDAMLEEIDDLIARLEKEGEQPIDIHPNVSSSVSSIVHVMITGVRLPHDHETRKLIDASFLPRGQGARPPIWSVFMFVPLAPKIVLNIPVGPVAAFFKRVRRILAYMKQLAYERQKHFDPKSGEVSNFIDAYLKEMSENTSGKYFDTQHLIGNSIAFFAAGSNTTGDFLTWFFLMMMAHPDVQHKVRQEVDNVIGSKRVSAKYRDAMPYTDAVIHELHRYCNMVPSGLPHGVLEDVELEGYLLPKGTQVAFISQAVHMNPDNFEQPEEFRPERFMSKDGKFVRSEKVMPFGVGKRACPGEPIANAEIFLYITSFLQKFEIVMPKGKNYQTAGVPDFLGQIPVDSPIHVVLRKR